MISASAEYRELLATTGGALVKATLTLFDGTVLELAGDDFMNGSWTFSQGVSSASSLDIGGAVTGRFDFTLNNYDGRFDDRDFTGARIVPYIGVGKSNGTTEWVRKGYFNVEQPSTYGAVIAVSALDNLVKLETPFEGAGVSFPASLQTIATRICSHCGVVLANPSFPNASFAVQAAPDGADLTCRQVLAHVAQVAGCYLRCRADGSVELGWFDLSAFSGTFSGVSLSAVSTLSVYTDDVVVTGLSVTASDGRDADGSIGAEGETARRGTDDYSLSVTGNPLVQAGSASAVADHLASRVLSLRCRPFDASGLLDPTVEPGDPIRITDGQGRTYDSYITNLTYKLGSYATARCGAATPSRNSASTYSAALQALAQAKELLRREKTAREAALDDLADRIGDSTSGFYTTAQTLQDGSKVFYMHDQSTLSGSTVVWKVTANAIAVSTDGGDNYTTGLDCDGNAILNRIYAIGIDADYINTGAITVENAAGTRLFHADIDTGEVLLSDATGRNHWNLSTGELSMTSGIVGVANLLNGTGAIVTGSDASWASRRWQAVRQDAAAATIARTALQKPPVSSIGYGVSISSDMPSYAGIMQSLVPVVEGNDYVLSCYARGTGYAWLACSGADDGEMYGAGVQIDSQSSWKRCLLRFVPGVDVTCLDASVDGMGVVPTVTVHFANTGEGTLEICGMKLERGQAATDWCPSFLDGEAYSASAASVALGQADVNSLAKATTALNSAKSYTNTVSERDAAFTKSQIQALDASLTQAEVLKRLTNNYAAKGMWLQDGQLYINGTYVRTGTLDAGIVKAGVLTDAAGKSQWNMVTGYFKTNNMVAYNAKLNGEFTCGGSDEQHIRLWSGTMTGYDGSTEAGSIDFATSVYSIDDNRTYNGIGIEGKGVIKLIAPRMAVATSISATAYECVTRKKTIRFLTSIEKNGSNIRWTSGQMVLQTLNGMVVAFEVSSNATA